ncbi:protein of unknown function [Cohaesibacter marisflavi]|uniref:Uncharacterized protein n=1 Tax=Cohaesibacter marisflavi TaxID=655353 RepID=A0A1I5IYQ0_9HYPH|nr:DUF4169 family protein [Cohaesibacter marisflavi]SFO65513.1 protein of unknown function [Cohaesibacter marisflavi]
MGNVINLRQARKAKARTEKEKKAEANRALFGQTKAQKTKQRFETDKLERHLDGHKREALGDASQMDDKGE